MKILKNFFFTVFTVLIFSAVTSSNISFAQACGTINAKLELVSGPGSCTGSGTTSSPTTCSGTKDSQFKITVTGSEPTGCSGTNIQNKISAGNGINENTGVFYLTWKYNTEATFTPFAELTNNGVSYSPQVLAGGIGTITITSPDTSAPTPNPPPGSADTSVCDQITWNIGRVSDPSGLHTEPYSFSAFSGGTSWRSSDTFTVQYPGQTGTKEMYIKTRDSLGNPSTTTRLTATIQACTTEDTLAPTIPTFVVAPSTWTNGSVNANATINDAGGSGIASYWYRCSASASYTKVTVSGAPNSYTVPTFQCSTQSEGSNGREVFFYAVDGAGNTSATARKKYFIDTTAPTNPNLFGYLDSGNTQNLTTTPVTISNPTFYFNWSGASDGESAVTDYKILVTRLFADGGAVLYDSGSLSGAVTSHSATVNFSESGTYRFGIKTRNGAGMWSSGSWQNFTVSITTTESVCTGWGGTWSGTSGSQDTGDCLSANIIPGLVTAFKNLSSQVVCSSFSMNNKTISACKTNSPRWAVANFDASGNRISTPVTGVSYASPSIATNCADQGTGRYLVGGWVSSTNPGKGDYCAEQGQKIKDAPTYDGSNPTDYFQTCNYESETCMCPDSAQTPYLPVGPTFPNATNFGERVPSNLASPVGQCLPRKVVLCLYIKDPANSSNSSYSFDGTNHLCTVPGDTPLVYRWLNNEWFLPGCPDGTTGDPSSSCTACGADEEGSASCCQNGSYIWNNDLGQCLPPARYECEVIMGDGILSAASQSRGYTNYFSSQGITPPLSSALFLRSNTTPNCQIYCEDAARISGMTSVLPANARWKSGTYKLLQFGETTAPFYSGTSKGICEWECSAGYTLNDSRNGCEINNDFGTITPPGDGTVPLPPENIPELPLGPGVNTKSYEAITQMRPEHWTSTNPAFFLSPSKDGASDVRLKFRIKESDTWPTDLAKLSQPLITWRIVAKDSNGRGRALSATRGCFHQPDAATNGSMLCGGHFYSSWGSAGALETDGFNNVTFINPHGRDSESGEMMSLVDFLNDGVQYPVLQIEMLEPVRDDFGTVVAPSVDYQLYVKTGSSEPTIPGGVNVVQIDAAVGGVRKNFEIRWVPGGLIPILNYTVFN